MEKNEQALGDDRPPQAQSTPGAINTTANANANANANADTTADTNIDQFASEKPRANLHSNQKPGPFGKHSLDIRRQPPVTMDSDSSSSPPPRTERAHSVPILDKDGQPLQPLPVHAPTNIRSARQRDVRSSVEFDRRLDGPYGRPSLVMARRQSEKERAEGHDDAGPLPGGPDREATETQAAGVASDNSTVQVLEPEPPPLNYTLHTRKMAIFIFWTFIIFDSVIMPIALYFGLWYGVGPGANTPTEKKQKLSANAVFSIVTAAIGGASILEYFVRFWRLYKKNSTCRVIGARRWYLDLFHWNFSLAWIIVMLELIVGTCEWWPPIRLLAMPLATMLFTFGTELLLVDLLRLFRVPAPMRMSSIPKGAQLRPCIYTMIEDVVAVDGSGGTEYREALNRRYEASHVFRSMLRKLGVFWAVGAEGMAVLCTILIFTVSDDAAFTIGWSVPFVWAGVWALCTIWYVKRELKKEKVAWAEQVSKSSA